MSSYLQKFVYPKNKCILTHNYNVIVLLKFNDNVIMCYLLYSSNLDVPVCLQCLLQLFHPNRSFRIYLSAFSLLIQISVYLFFEPVQNMTHLSCRSFLPALVCGVLCITSCLEDSRVWLAHNQCCWMVWSLQCQAPFIISRSFGVILWYYATLFCRSFSPHGVSSLLGLILNRGLSFLWPSN